MKQTGIYNTYIFHSLPFDNLTLQCLSERVYEVTSSAEISAEKLFFSWMLGANAEEDVLCYPDELYLNQVKNTKT